MIKRVDSKYPSLLYDVFYYVWMYEFSDIKVGLDLAMPYIHESDLFITFLHIWNL